VKCITICLIALDACTILKLLSTYLPCTYFNLIHFIFPQLGEFAEYTHKVKLTKDTARLEEAVAFHNGVTQWTICNIMKEFTSTKWVDVNVKFIDVNQVRRVMSLCLYLGFGGYLVMCVCSYKFYFLLALS